MMEKHIINTCIEGERVTSTYAEIYFDEVHCDYKKPQVYKYDKRKPSRHSIEAFNTNKKLDEWASPSDILIGKVGLQPPLTSKTVRGQTHQGVLQIGDGVLQAEKKKFLNYLYKLLRENDAAWTFVLDFEKEQVIKSIKADYEKRLIETNKIISKEISKYYENSLQELENCLRSDLQDMLLTARANIISDSNSEIQENLKFEYDKLDSILNERYQSEVKKLKSYYKLLLDDEHNRCNKIIQAKIIERNDAVKAFYRQLEAETLTSAMYVMSAERKKCRIRKIILENHQTSEIAEQVQIIMKKQDVLNSLKENEIFINNLSEQLEEKIKKIVHLFFKFINYSLKLLPEQSAFLTDLQNLLILQLNEIQKAPVNAPTILQNEEDIQNAFNFQNKETNEQKCEKEPFVIEGDLSPEPVAYHGSKETLSSDVSLPMIRVQRQFLYAKCHKFEEVKAFLESQRCKCYEQDVKPDSEEPEHIVLEEKPASLVSIESNETLFVENFNRFAECPSRRCNDWKKIYSFPDMDSYIDFTEENFERVKVILSEPHDEIVLPDLLEARDISESELLFAATKVPYRNVATQCLSQEIFNPVTCTCIAKDNYVETHNRIQKTSSQILNDILLKRKRSMVRLLHEHPHLLQIFTDEDNDFHV